MNIAVEGPEVAPALAGFAPVRAFEYCNKICQQRKLVLIQSLRWPAGNSATTLPSESQKHSEHATPS
jgi:hypothetical protein